MKKKEEIHYYSSLASGQEEFVRHLFSLYADKIGFDIINIQKRFPDCIAIDKRNGKNEKVLVELEYEAKNFLFHGHDKQVAMQSDKCICLCWKDEGSNEVRNCLPDRQIEVVCLQNLPNIVFIEKEMPVLRDSQSTEPEYIMLFYNSKYADNEPLSSFKEIKVFRTTSLAGKKNLTSGSKIIIFESGTKKIIGELTVAKFVNIPERPQTDKEKLLYELMTYPVADTDFPNEGEEWYPGHIIFSDIKIYNPPINRETVPSLKNKSYPRGRFMKLSKEEYLDIVGK